MSNAGVWAISTSSGAVTPLKSLPRACEKRHWTEADLQHCFVLAPEILSVERQLPLSLDGKSTETCPDQLYLDELGRLTIVEIKNERAGLDAIAQLMGYSEHWRCSPCHRSPPSAQI